MTAGRRHPAEVTRARLLRHYEEWWDRMSGSEHEAISEVREILQRIADEDELRREEGDR